MTKRKTTRETGRTRNFTTVVYPESAPEGWLSILDDFHVQAFVSPLHDKDLDPNGERKKPHWHVLIMFDGVKTVAQAEGLFKKIGGVGCQKINSVRGNARYLCHLDNPEKAQYDPQDVLAFAGADYSEVCSLVSDKYATFREMLTFCETNSIFNFADLLIYASENRNDWFKVLCDGGVFVIKEYIKSRNWCRENSNASNT